jgi:hypothetical protein
MKKTKNVTTSIAETSTISNICEPLSQPGRIVKLCKRLLHN